MYKQRPYLNMKLYIPAAFAVALAIMVFPQPGGPYINTPVHYIQALQTS